jgi:anti-sigma-K factor RskA
MQESTQDRVIDWAMGRMSAEEVAAMEQEFDRDAELKAFALEIRETVASLALASPGRHRPPGLAQKILRGNWRRSRIVASAPWTVAACLATALLMFYMERTRLLDRIDRLTTEQQFARYQISFLQSQLNAYNQAAAVIVWDPKTETGVVQFENMPAPGAGKDYQLWVVDPEKAAPVNAGVLILTGGQTAKIPFKTDQPVRSVTKFVISLEPAGGVPKSVGPAVLTSR